jgi:hypothetical protein
MAEMPAANTACHAATPRPHLISSPHQYTVHHYMAANLPVKKRHLRAFTFKKKTCLQGLPCLFCIRCMSRVSMVGDPRPRVLFTLRGCPTVCGMRCAIFYVLKPYFTGESAQPWMAACGWEAPCSHAPGGKHDSQPKIVRSPGTPYGPYVHQE